MNWERILGFFWFGAGIVECSWGSWHVLIGILLVAFGSMRLGSHESWDDKE